jgi:hypothetical protein
MKILVIPTWNELRSNTLSLFMKYMKGIISILNLYVANMKIKVWFLIVMSSLMVVLMR